MPVQAPRLGGRGLLDPLLFLRASSSQGNTAGSTPGTKTEESTGDLRDVLQKAEAEYAAIPVLQSTEPQSQQQRGRQAWRDRPGSRQGSQGRVSHKSSGGPEQYRGKKRRPCSQEPRPVSTAPVEKRQVESFPQVEAFLKEKKLRCRKFELTASFRSITFNQQRKKTDAVVKPDAPNVTTANSDVATAKPDATPAKRRSPWEEYFRANGSFVRQGNFMHSVAFLNEGVAAFLLLCRIPRECPWSTWLAQPRHPSQN